MKKNIVMIVSVVLFFQWISFASDYSEEYQKAYNYAYSHWITVAKSIDDAKMYSSLDRISMAKMISKFAINVLWILPDKTLECRFEDVSDELDAQYGYWVTKACQLWLMWISDDWKKSDKFNPKWIVRRWQWATVFSRALSKYNADTVKEWNPYYQTHLQYLYSKWIIKSITNPDPKSEEKRWNVMLMLYRVKQSIIDYEDDNLIGWFQQPSVDENWEDIDNQNEEKNDWKLEDNQIENLDDSTNEQITYHRVDNSYSQFLMSDFNSVEDVYHGIKSGDRVIFLVRHSERITDCTSGWWLTNHGIDLADWVWKKLQGAPFEDTSTDFYGSSITKRTVQTSYYLGKSRGSKVLKEVLDDDVWDQYDYVNHSSDIDEVVYWNYFSDWNSYSSIEHLYEENKDIVNERALYSIEKLCDMTQWHPFSWITTHDWFTLPITERATDENLTFSQSKYQWPNFMQWVAIIVHPDWWWEIYPVRSLEMGMMDTWDNPSC